MIRSGAAADVESFEPVVRDLDTSPETKDAYEKWAAGRTKFIKDLGKPDSEARQEKWQKDYMQGGGPGGDAPEHQVKLNVREFDLPKPPQVK